VQEALRFGSEAEGIDTVEIARVGHESHRAGELSRMREAVFIEGARIFRISEQAPLEIADALDDGYFDFVACEKRVNSHISFTALYVRAFGQTEGTSSILCVLREFLQRCLTGGTISAEEPRNDSFRRRAGGAWPYRGCIRGGTTRIICTLWLTRE